MELVLDRLTIRPWKEQDAAPLAALANNPRIFRNTSDRFPHPYSLADAESFIARVRDQDPPRDCAMCLEAQPIGGIGVTIGEGIYRRTAEVGYWLGEPYWGRGYASEALRAYTAYAFERFDLVRINAMVFTWNPASARVLEHAGYTCDATIRASAVKLGQVVDEWRYGLVRPGLR